MVTRPYGLSISTLRVEILQSAGTGDQKQGKIRFPALGGRTHLHSHASKSSRPRPPRSLHSVGKKRGNLREDHQQRRRDDNGYQERPDAREYPLHAHALRHSVYHVDVDAHRRRYHSHSHHIHYHDPKPDGVVAQSIYGQGIENGDGEQNQTHDDEGGHGQGGQELRQLKGQPADGHKPAIDSRSGQKKENHRRGLGSVTEGRPDLLQAQPPLQHSYQEHTGGTHSPRLRGGEPSREESSQREGEDQHGLDQAALQSMN